LDGRYVILDLDDALADDLFMAVMADSKAMLVFAASHGVTRLSHRLRRMTQLWRHQWWTRIDPNLTHLTGSKACFYCFETGRGQLTYETRRDYRQLSDTQRAEILKECAPLRRATIEYLTRRGWPADLVESRLESNANAICRFTSRDESSQVPHRLLGAEALAILFLGVRSRGIAVTNRHPDGDLVLAAHVDKVQVKIEPDAFFVLGDTGIALEVETGSAGKKATTAKIRAYLALFHLGIARIIEQAGARMQQFCVLFYCATRTHAAMIEQILLGLSDPGTGYFRVVTQHAMGLAMTEHGEPILRDMLARNAPVHTTAMPAPPANADAATRAAYTRAHEQWAKDTVPVLTYLKDRISAPIFRCKIAKGFISVPLFDCEGATRERTARDFDPLDGSARRT
jgi:hypothetical protein